MIVFFLNARWVEGEGGGGYFVLNFQPHCLLKLDGAGTVKSLSPLPSLPPPSLSLSLG